MSQISHMKSSGEVNSSKEVTSGFIASSCKGTKLFEFTKEIFNRMACLA